MNELDEKQDELYMSFLRVFKRGIATTVKYKIKTASFQKRFFITI
jgi:hypothetical protein